MRLSISDQLALSLIVSKIGSAATYQLKTHIFLRQICLTPNVNVFLAEMLHDKSLDTGIINRAIIIPVRPTILPQRTSTADRRQKTDRRHIVSKTPRS